MRTLRLAAGAVALSAALVSAAPAAGAPAQDTGCDAVDPARCLFPWPNDHFTVRDKSTPTGRRVSLRRELMPTNRAGVPIEPSDYNYADGFSPGSTIITKVPGLDTPEALERTGAVPLTDLGKTYARRAPIVVIDAETGRRQLIWAELDSNASTAADRALLIRPAKNLREGRRYIVALRRLRDADGNLLQPSPAFKSLRDGHGHKGKHRGHDRYARIFKELRRAGIERDDLYLAWDFTVASARGLSGRLRNIRDDAFRELGDTDLDDLRVGGALRRSASTGSPTWRRAAATAARARRTTRSAAAWRAPWTCPATWTSRVARPGRVSSSGRTATRCARPATSTRPTSSATSRAR